MIISILASRFQDSLIEFKDTLLYSTVAIGSRIMRQHGRILVSRG